MKKKSSHQGIYDWIEETFGNIREEILVKKNLNSFEL